MLSQRVQYHNASKFTAGFQLYPFIVLYRYGDIHWSWQIILFIIEHYPTHATIRFISCPTCLHWGIWTDIRADIKEIILPCTWCDNIHKEHFNREGDGIYICCAWQKYLTFPWWHRVASSYWNVGANRKNTFDLTGCHRPPDHSLALNTKKLGENGIKSDENTATVPFKKCNPPQKERKSICD